MSFAITYNGLNLNFDNGLLVQRMDGVDGLPIRTSSQSLTAQDGGNIWKQQYDMRTIGLEGTVRGTDATDYFENKRALVQAFSIVPNALELSITKWDALTKTIYAKTIVTPQIIENSGENTIARWRVEMLCESPFFQDGTEQTLQLTPSAESGYPVATNLPNPVGQLTGTNTGSITNGGDVEGYAEFVISGAISNPTITNLTTGESFTINRTIASGDYVRVKQTTQGLSVSLNDSTSILSDFDGDFFDLPVGSNTIRLTSGSSTGTLDVFFKNLYISL